MQHFNQLPCPVLVTDCKGLVQTVNANLLQLIGENAQACVSHPMDAMFSMASRIFLQTHVWPMLLRDGQIQEIQLQMINGAGEKIPVLLNCQKSTQADMDCYVWIFFITRERNRYEQALLEARQSADAAKANFAKGERFIRTVTDALPSMISYWDQQLRCQFSNQTYLEWFGKTPNQMLGMSMSALLGEQLFALDFP